MATPTMSIPMTMAATVEQMEAQHRLWGAKIQQLEAAGESRRVQAKIDRRKRLDDLKAMHRVARVKLDALKAAGIERWQAFTADVARAGNDLDSALGRTDKRTATRSIVIWIAALALVVLWTIALISSTTLGGYIHVLLLPALAIVGLRLIRLRRAASSRE